MTKHEKEILFGFCEELSERFSNDSCNDYWLDFNQENIDLARAAHGFTGDPEPFEPPTEGPDFTIDNGTLLIYLAYKMLHEKSPDDGDRQG